MMLRSVLLGGRAAGPAAENPVPDRPPAPAQARRRWSLQYWCLLACLLPALVAAPNYTIDPNTDEYAADVPVRLFNVDHDPLIANRPVQIYNKRSQRFIAVRTSTTKEVPDAAIAGSRLEASSTQPLAHGEGDIIRMKKDLSSSWRLLPVPGRKDSYWIALLNEDLGSVP